MAAYEALAYVLAALSTAHNSQYLDLVETKQTNQARKFSLDICVTTFLNNINHLLTDGILTRSRRAVLMAWKVRIIFCSVSSVLTVDFHLVDDPQLMFINKPAWMTPNC